MKSKKKRNKWLTIVTVVVAVGAIYFAIGIARGISHYSRGTDLMAGGDYDQAILCFDKAIEVEGKFPEAYCNRGAAYFEKGDYDRAFDDFTKAIELDPEIADAYGNRAVVYYQKKEYDKAWADVHKAQSLGYQISENFIASLRGSSGREG
jgi:tetratricopeptide (TPR) repeat protein